MPRQRSYSSEYQARNARYKAEYGVSYNEYRRLARNAKAEGIEGGKVRTALAQFKAQGAPPKASMDKLTAQLGEAKSAYRRGDEVEFDYAEWADYDLDDEWAWYH